MSSSDPGDREPVQKRAQARAATFEAALDRLPIGVVIFDDARRIEFCNAAYRAIYDLAAQDCTDGASIAGLIRRRLELGLQVSADREDYVRARLEAPISAAQATHQFSDGRVIAYSISPLPSGGGVAAHYDVSDRAAALEAKKQLISELELQNRRFDVALGTMAQGLCMLDDQLRVVACNERYRELFCLPEQVARPGAHLSDIVAYNVAAGRHPGETLEQVMSRRLAIFQKGEPATLQTKGFDGTRTIETVYRPVKGGGWVATYDDITDRVAAERALAEQNLRFGAALNNMPHGLSMFDGNRRLIVCNRKFAETYRLPPELTEPGTSFDDIIAYRVATNQAPQDADGYRHQMRQVGEQGRPASYKVALTDGRTIQVDYEPMEGGGWVVTHQDVTEAIKAESQIRHLARHDPLTNLPNRLLFQERLADAMVRSARGEKIAVLCVDLDQFKTVNDTCGHAAGDALLRQVADRLRASVRETDTVARLGGDEFAIIQCVADQPQGATTLASRVIESLALPCVVGERRIEAGASIGIALAPDDGPAGEQLLQCADLALYRAKAEGRGTYRFFEAAMDAKMRARRSLEIDLRHALDRGEFTVFYQPLVCLEQCKTIGFEALLRWRNPQRGLIPPAEFIPIAEDIGLISQIGAWVLTKACEDAAQWPGDIKVAVNLSPAQFKNPRLVLDVASALGSSGLPARRLELEITETVMLHDTEATLAILRQIKDLGVSIAMDDFGTGYSSLSYLRKFPFDKIKIDQSFIREISREDESMAIVRAVVGLGGSLGMVTTAEGVETAEQLESLRQEGCNLVQGFFFSPAVPAGEIAGLLERLEQHLRAA